MYYIVAPTASGKTFFIDYNLDNRLMDADKIPAVASVYAEMMRVDPHWWERKGLLYQKDVAMRDVFFNLEAERKPGIVFTAEFAPIALGFRSVVVLVPLSEHIENVHWRQKHKDSPLIPSLEDLDKYRQETYDVARTHRLNLFSNFNDAVTAV